MYNSILLDKLDRIEMLEEKHWNCDLINRNQSTKVNGISSKKLIEIGVPQGSIVGLLL